MFSSKHLDSWWLLQLHVWIQYTYIYLYMSACLYKMDMHIHAGNLVCNAVHTNPVFLHRHMHTYAYTYTCTHGSCMHLEMHLSNRMQKVPYWPYLCYLCTWWHTSHHVRQILHGEVVKINEANTTAMDGLWTMCAYGRQIWYRLFGHIPKKPGVFWMKLEYERFKKPHWGW